MAAEKVGVVTDTGHMVVKQHGIVVADIPASSLTDKAPVYFRESMVPSYFVETSAWTPESASLPEQVTGLSLARSNTAFVISAEENVNSAAPESTNRIARRRRRHALPKRSPPGTAASAMGSDGQPLAALAPAPRVCLVGF